MLVKVPGARDVFFSRSRRNDFDGLRNTWQAQEFARVAKTLAGVMDLRVRNYAIRVAGARISRSVMSMFEASDAESVEGLQVSLQGSFRVAVTGVRTRRLHFFVAGAVLLKLVFSHFQDKMPDLGNTFKMKHHIWGISNLSQVDSRQWLRCQPRGTSVLFETSDLKRLPLGK